METKYKLFFLQAVKHNADLNNLTLWTLETCQTASGSKNHNELIFDSKDEAVKQVKSHSAVGSNIWVLLHFKNKNGIWQLNGVESGLAKM